MSRAVIKCEFDLVFYYNLFLTITLYRERPPIFDYNPEQFDALFEKYDAVCPSIRPSTTSCKETELRNRRCDRFMPHLVVKEAFSVREGGERKKTMFLISVSLAHFLLNLPSYGCNMLSIMFQVECSYSIAAFAYLLFYSQFAVNFFLYSCHQVIIRYFSRPT